MSMPIAPAPANIAHTISLAIAPAFLLAGIGSLLNVVAQRLGRAVDRARVIEARFAELVGAEHDRAVGELRTLDRRMTLANWSVLLCTSAAVLVCLVIASLFLAQLFGRGYGRAIAIAFVFAMTLLITGLGVFLFEVRLGLLSVRVRVELLEHPDPAERRWAVRRR